MMLSRRIASTNLGARAWPVRKPSSSGPRWRIAAVIRRTRDSASALREANATPHIPHTLLLDLRRREEGRANAQHMLAQMKSADSHTAVGIPGENESPHKQVKPRNRGDHPIDKRVPVPQEAAVHDAR